MCTPTPMAGEKTLTVAHCHMRACHLSPEKFRGTEKGGGKQRPVHRGERASATSRHQKALDFVAKLL